MINADGIETFKSIEEEVLNAINVKNTVIATGGSAVYYDSAMRHLKENGVVVYIEASLATIKKRLKNIRTRGVAMEKGQTIDSLYEMRVPLYEKYADCTVRSHRYRAENTVEDIISGLEKIKI
ncbi:MAG: shikimate kinase [Clostridia bacterium]